MAWFGLVAGQLHALARHNTVEGKTDLQAPLVRLWSDPARSALKPLLNWASPDAVYLTYGKIWLPVFLGFTLCAFVVRRRRNPLGFERLAWKIALIGYVWASFAVFLSYWTQLNTYNAIFEMSSLVAIPGLLITLIGSTMLGISLLRHSFTPKLPAWLLTLTIPLAIVITQVTSQGSLALPVMFAFGILGHRISRESTHAPVVDATALEP